MPACGRMDVAIASSPWLTRRALAPGRRIGSTPAVAKPTRQLEREPQSRGAMKQPVVTGRSWPKVLIRGWRWTLHAQACKPRLAGSPGRLRELPTRSGTPVHRLLRRDVRGQRGGTLRRGRPKLLQWDAGGRNCEGKGGGPRSGPGDT